MPDDVRMPQDIQMPDGNLFMVCERVERGAFGALPRGVELRCCRHDELDLWKAMHFDLPETAREFKPYMSAYMRRTASCSLKGAGLRAWTARRWARALCGRRMGA